MIGHFLGCCRDFIEQGSVGVVMIAVEEQHFVAVREFEAAEAAAEKKSGTKAAETRAKNCDGLPLHYIRFYHEVRIY